ncbi:GGDEF domain-containing protein, partial [Candidatus Daviesbacteria bacterium]|nr:GGDEF domain-containing protein [Candidatus Daviesbacteria bacterium]
MERRSMSEQSRGEEPSITDYLESMDVTNPKVAPVYSGYMELGKKYGVKDLASFAREATIRALKEAAIHPLSGLPTLKILQIMSDRELSLAAREKKPLTVAFIDMNRFKDINDNSAAKHAAGDAAI